MSDGTYESRMMRLVLNNEMKQWSQTQHKSQCSPHVTLPIVN